MSFSETDKTDIRRYCGYPMPSVSGLGVLEYRLLNMSMAEETVARTYLATLRTLEAAIPASGSSLDTQQAAVWTRNPAELTERTRLFDDWRRRLCGFLAVPSGASLASGGIRLVV